MENDLGQRTKRYAINIVLLYTSLPTNLQSQVIGKQFLRSGTSVGAQYREARRARSRAEFVSKLECALQELDETEYWLEILHETGIVHLDKIKHLLAENKQLSAIFTASCKTAKENGKQKK